VALAERLQRPGAELTHSRDPLSSRGGLSRVRTNLALSCRISVRVSYEPWPCLDGIGRSHDVHPGADEALEGGVGLVGVVDHPGTTTAEVQSSRRYIRSARRRSWARSVLSRSSIVHATQWLLACPATATASKVSSFSMSSTFLVPRRSPSGPSVTSGPSME